MKSNQSTSVVALLVSMIDMIGGLAICLGEVRPCLAFLLLKERLPLSPQSSLFVLIFGLMQKLLHE